MKFFICKKEYNVSSFMPSYAEVKFNEIGSFNLFIMDGNKNILNYDQIKCNNKIYLVVGDIYEKTNRQSMAEFVKEKFIYSGIDGVTNLDGDFVFIVVDKNSVIIIADREGSIPIYYNNSFKKFIISNSPDILFNDFKIDDISLSSVYDFLRWGTFIGNNTLSNEIKLLRGGQWLKYKNDTYYIKEYYMYRCKSEQLKYNKNKLIDSLVMAYEVAIKKRTSNLKGKCALFLSGGLDSRLLLVALNNILRKTDIKCFSFGQKFSEEVDIARKVACINQNDFKHLVIKPSDFLTHYNDYLRMTMGSDAFPQSYIIDIAKLIKNEATYFITGTFLDAYIGSTFLNLNAIEDKGKWSDRILDYTKTLKMELFNDEEIKKLCKYDVYEKFFKKNTDNILIEAQRYDEYQIRNIIQPFGIENRGKRLVLNRELAPGNYIKYIKPSFDRDFLNVVSKIPAEWRLGGNFYRELFMKYAPKYANVVNNNTNVPISAPIEMWKEGVQLEYSRELLFEEMMKKQCNNLSLNLFYPHYYSDFDGYSRYDKMWVSFIRKTLLENALITKLWFNESVLENMLIEHINSKKNNRKKLIYLVSLELSLKSLLS